MSRRTRRIAPVLLERSRYARGHRDRILATDNGICLTYGPDINHKHDILTISLGNKRFHYRLEVDKRNVNEIIRFVIKCRKGKLDPSNHLLRASRAFALEIARLREQGQVLRGPTMGEQNFRAAIVKAQGGKLI